MKRVVLSAVFVILIISGGFIRVSAVGQEVYTIQAGSFENLLNADRLYNRLVMAGLPAYRVKDEYYRVLVGKYRTEGEARAVLAKIERLGIRAYIKKVMVAPGELNEPKKNLNEPPKKPIKEPEPINEPKKEVSAAKNGYYEPQNDLKVKNFLLNSDITMKGVFGSHIFFFYVDEYWEVGAGSYLELIFTQSGVIKDKNSTLTVSLNDFPIYSMFLYDRGENREKVKIRLPVDKIRRGYNGIELVTFRRITDEPCTDEVNPGNWLVFHRESFVHLEFREKRDSEALKEYPYPFLKESEENPVNCLILLPEAPDGGHLQAAMMIAANFGGRQRYKNLNIRVEKFSKASDKKGNNLIFIGGLQNLPPEWRSLLTPEELKTVSHRALIKKTVSPYNNNFRLLLILSDDGAALRRAAEALTVDDVVAQMNTAAQIITGALEINDELTPDSDYLSLADLGYENVLLKGLTHQAAFGINLPKNWLVKKGAYLEVKLRYAKVLDFGRSYLTVHINGVPIGSKELAPERADDDLFRIEIPEGVRESNYYNLQIDCFMAVKDHDCSYLDQSWLFISNQSYLYLPHTNRKENLLENFTGLFVKNNQFYDLLVILPEDPSNDDLSIGANLLAFLGHEAKSVKNMEVITADEFSDRHKEKNLIIIGAPRKNPLIREVNEELYIKFDQGFSGFLSNDKISLLGAYKSKPVSLQLIDSPYNKERKAMIITAAEEENLLRVQRYLADYQFMSRLKGNAVIIDEAGDIKWAYYGERPAEKTVPPTIPAASREKFKEVFKDPETGRYILFAVMTLFIIALSLIFIIRNNRR